MQEKPTVGLRKSVLALHVVGSDSIPGTASGPSIATPLGIIPVHTVRGNSLAPSCVAPNQNKSSN